jgi:hypothetical protein
MRRLMEWCGGTRVNARGLLAVTAVLEGVTGLALLAMPSVTITLLLGQGLEAAPAIVVARLAGTALVAIAVGCAAARTRTPNEQRSLVLGLLVYNLGTPLLLVSSAWHAGLRSPGVWPASLLHTLLLAWCIACLRGR